MDGREYQVGRFTLQPFRQLSEAGDPVAVKPKALAILSVLAEADGALVTKDDLMAAVWPNIIVEDNAIQAHVVALRKILGRDAELLCTVHGLGYRLDRTQAVLPAETPAAPARVEVPATSASRHSLWWASAVSLAACAAVGSFWFLRNPAPVTPAPRAAQVAVLPFDHSATGPEIDNFSDDLLHETSNDLTDAGIMVGGAAGKDLAISNSGNAKVAEFLLGGRIKAEGKAVEVDAELTDAAEHLVVWSGTFQDSADARIALVSRVATEAANAAHWAVIGRTGKVRLDGAGVAAFVAARNSISVVGRNAPALESENYKKVIAAAPDFTWGHSGLAAAYAFQLRGSRENEALRNEARQEANRALELESHNGEAYLALELLSPRFYWKKREDLLLKGFDADPGFEPAAMHEGRLLWSVGRNHDALPWFKRAYNTDPLHNDNTFTYAASLASEGYPGESRKLVAQMEAKWPEQIATKNARFWTSVISGATDDTLNILHDSAEWPLGMNQKSAEVWHAALTAHASNERSARSRAIKFINSAAAEGSLNRGEALLLLSMLDDIDGAFAQAQYYEPADPRWGPFLFLEQTKGMRFDPRFMLLAVKFGYAAYWRATNQWPDFCYAPDLPYNCKAEVEKLSVQNRGLEPITALRPIGATH